MIPGTRMARILEESLTGQPSLHDRRESMYSSRTTIQINTVRDTKVRSIVERQRAAISGAVVPMSVVVTGAQMTVADTRTTEASMSVRDGMKAGFFLRIGSMRERPQMRE